MADQAYETGTPYERVRAYLDAHGSEQEDYIEDPRGAYMEFCWKHPVYADDLRDLLHTIDEAHATITGDGRG